MRRIFWTLVGLGMGAVIGAQVVRWANRTRSRYSAPNLAREAGGKFEELKARAAVAVASGVDEMVRREQELRSELGLDRR